MTLTHSKVQLKSSALLLSPFLSRPGCRIRWIRFRPHSMPLISRGGETTVTPDRRVSVWYELVQLAGTQLQSHLTGFLRSVVRPVLTSTHAGPE